jgi:RNAse (barnase) inhibitor barstar
VGEIKMKEIYERMNLHALLETIQANLAFNIDSMYSQAKELIGTEKEHNLGHLKELLKGQIEGYLKIVVKNIRQKILYQEFDDYIAEINEAIK